MQNENKLTDGKIYEKNDMVKLECGECEGCFSCCQGMGDSVTLNPYDIWQLEINLHKSFEELLQDKLELGISEGVIVPNLKMSGTQETCGFLNENGRCSIHAFRPGICRLFPLGRQYDKEKIGYIFLEHACPKPNKTKVKIKKWLGIPQLEANEMFLLRWHAIQKKVQQLAKVEDKDTVQELNMYLLNLFFAESYRGDFYAEFEKRAQMAEKLLEKLKE